MKATATRKANRMLAAEERKLSKLVPELLRFYGFTRISDDPAYFVGAWSRDCPRFDENGNPCRLEVRPISDGNGHPWLACCFHRKYRDQSKRWDDPANSQTYRDIRHALGDMNEFSGKYNQHVFERCTAADCIEIFEQHLRSVFPGGPWYS